MSSSAAGRRKRITVNLKRIVVFSLVSAFAVPVAVCGIYKPLRVVAPETFGLHCVADDICVEEIDTIAEATFLRDEALKFVVENIGQIKDAPRFLMCSSEECFARFGNPAVAALYVWGLETVIINRRGWHDHILRHELIHHWQNEQFGTLRSSRLPRWYVEGMAYSLSQDPRNPLPRSDIQSWREQFEAWLDDGNDRRQPP